MTRIGRRLSMSHCRGSEFGVELVLVAFWWLLSGPFIWRLKGVLVGLV